MPADLATNEAIPGLAEQIDSPTMLGVLRLLQQRGFIQNAKDVDTEMFGLLQRLAELGLVDPGYARPTDGKPFIWVRNAIGERVLKYIETSRRFEVRIHPRAQTALASLSDKDRQAVLAAAESLLDHDAASWPRDRVVRLGQDKPTYLLRVTPDLRAFVMPLAAGDIELSDIVRKETLELFREQQREATVVP